MRVVTKIITSGDDDFNEIVEWVEHNCPSFERYKLVELDDEERDSNPDCWFKLEFHFNNDVDATLFALRWL